MKKCLGGALGVTADAHLMKASRKTKNCSTTSPMITPYAMTFLLLEMGIPWFRFFIIKAAFEPIAYPKSTKCKMQTLNEQKSRQIMQGTMEYPYRQIV